MKKSVILISFLFCTFCIFSQDKSEIYVDNDKDYVLFIDNDVVTLNKVIEGAEIDVFVKSTDKKLKYTLLVTKIVQHDFVDGNLLDDDYDKYFSDNCECTVTGNEIVYYNNLNSIRHKVKINREGKEYIGYNNSFVSNKILYNVLFLTFESSFEEEKHKSAGIMNRFIINGRSTIDRYKEYKIRSDEKSNK